MYYDGYTGLRADPVYKFTARVKALIYLFFLGLPTLKIPKLTDCSVRHKNSQQTASISDQHFFGITS